MYPIKQNTSLDLSFFAHDTAGVAVGTLADGTWTKRISKNGATWGAMTVTITFQENGWFGFTLSSSHTDTLGILSITFTNASCMQVNLQFRVTANTFDDLATQASVNTVDDFLDTEVAAILAAVDTEVGAIKTKTDFLPSVTAGAAGGLFIAGTNAATTITTALTTTFTGNLTGSVGSVTAAVDISAAAIQAIWDALTTALTTAGSIGKRISDFLTGDAFARLGAPAGASVSADIAAIKTETASLQTDTNDLQTRLPAALVSGRIDASLGAAAADTLTASALATDAVQEIRDAILSDSTPFPGANINASISSRATPAQVNSEVVDALNVDTYAEVAALPAATSSIVSRLGFIFALTRNKITQTATTQSLRNDADDAAIATTSISDDATTFVKNEWT